MFTYLFSAYVVSIVLFHKKQYIEKPIYYVNEAKVEAKS